MMGRYAADTSVSVERSRAEIESTLSKYGATTFAFFSNQTTSMIAFEACGRRVKFELPMPDKEEFWLTPTGKARAHDAAHKAWEQAQRSSWRALCLVIKAKLEAVESGITEFESEFLAHIMLPDGSTVGQQTRPLIARAYESGEMPKLLPALEG